ncbi:LacI family DNA-binding transcriptional regulator [Actinoplanes sp. DH11]|uniref:LacI family DNA-binding transcriptional regulator n=1 Tax=Actinoplanes sp. DH11 TaxID=2857011 RepID=UPI001E3EA07C|nr:substrate-binding domain-containing protein [Actinoplanes sp. DH11]
MNGLIGLVFAGDATQVGVEPFFMELIAGMEEALAPHGATVLLLVVPDREAELGAYRRWSADHTVDAVVVVNLTHDDPRPALLADLGLPAVLAGHGDTDRFPRVITDDAGAVTTAVEAFVALGHRHIARVTGPKALIHTAERSAAMLTAGHTHGVRVTEAEGDYGPESAVRAVRTLLRTDPPPTAMIFDNDVMAVAALGELSRSGIPVPARLSLLALDDSPLCELSSPPLSALSKNVHAHGLILARAVLAAVAGQPPTDHPGPVPHLIHRATTGPAFDRL